MSGTLAEILRDALKPAGHAVASTSGESRQGDGLLALAERVRLALAERHVVPHEPVHISIGNRASDLGALLGIWQAGAVAVPIHALAASSTVARVQRISRARFLLDGERLDAIGQAPPPDRALLRDAALVIFTSGSTGEPKGVVIGHRRLADKLAVLDRLLNIEANDVMLCPLQLTFIFGVWVSLLTLMKGARLILVPKFTGEAIARGLADATVLAGVPSMFRTLLTHSDVTAPKLRAILSGGEVLAPVLAHALAKFSRAAIHDLYGLTETGSCDFHVGPADQPHGFGTIGHPTERVTFRIDSKTGELQIRTPFGMLGYLDNPAVTEALFDGGYFKTGDLARLTADGAVALIGRAKDIISRGGNKIAPLEIDNLLAEHPEIAAALCAGVADERLGEVVHAVIVPRAGACLDAAALRDWLLARTERFKVPDVFHFRDALPSGASGKADRRAVAQLAAQTSNRR
ncbi:MAG: fatty acid--CoA ligase family protein [Xanthobacteraceae bacterium]|jgi:acyl-CoA synthetase (AMP-forming)/AMP-acid ligase II